MFTHHRLTAFLILGTILLFGCSTPELLADACSSPLSPVVANSCVVTTDVLWRGARPDVDGATALITLGVKTVVNLELLHDDLAAFSKARPTTVPSPTIAYFRIRDWEPNVIIASALLDSHLADFIAIARTQAKPIYIHCRSGQNRTGVMVAAYRILLEGLPIEAAIDEMENYQGIWFRQDEKYIRGLTGEHRLRIEKMAEARLGRIRPEALLDCSAAGCIAIGQ